MRYNVWIEQTIHRATVVTVDAADADQAEILAVHAAEDRPWSHVEVTDQTTEVRVINTPSYRPSRNAEDIRPTA